MSRDGFNTTDLNQNPYSPTAETRREQQHVIVLPPGQKRGMVGHTTVLGILMIIQGVLDFIAGIFVGFYAWFMPQVFMEMQAEMAKQAAKNGGQAPQGLPPDFGMYIAIGGGIFAVVLVLIGTLTIYSGIGVMKFQRRVLAVISLLLGMLTLLTCYCFPTSFLLATYGLIVLFSQSVAYAFHLRSEGYAADDIQIAFLSPPPPQSNPLDF
ncbi:MAG: hypothetical protein WBD20_07835 [Pirellulaceae bacterium]